jgi:hypothetical protein
LDTGTIDRGQRLRASARCAGRHDAAPRMPDDAGRRRPGRGFNARGEVGWRMEERMTERPITILIADDHPVVREGLAAIPWKIESSSP